MTSYEKLIDEAMSEGLIVKEAALQSGDGRCRGRRIAIRKNIPTISKKADILAEELGHYHTTVGRIVEQNDILSRKQERTARLWAYDKRIGLGGLANAWEHGCRNQYEISDFLGVSEDTLAEALDFYRQKHGTGVWTGNYKIQFEPYLKIGKMLMFDPED